MSEMVSNIRKGCINNKKDWAYGSYQPLIDQIRRYLRNF